MHQTYLLTIAGADRTGIMEQVAAAIAGAGGNWLESRLAHLGDHFAGVVRFSAPERDAGAILAGLGALAGEGLSVAVHPEAGRPVEDKTRARAGIEIFGMDRPGIVSRITRALARHQINVEEFASGTESAPMSGEPLFRATARLSLPHDQSIDSLRDEILEIARELDLDIDLV